jgi:AcrR family transcriptional regulator
MLPFYVLDTDPPAKREILRAAMKLFSQHGLAATTIRDIAKESGYTNPALYKHFVSKEELALYLFETSHRRLWSRCQAALERGASFDAKLENYIGEVLSLVDEHPEAMMFLSENARVLWPKSGPAVRRQTMIALARSLMSAAPRAGKRSAVHPDIAAASLQGTLAELARMIQVGAVRGPARDWKAGLLKVFRAIAAA